MSKSITLLTLIAVAILSGVFLTACIPGPSDAPTSVVENTTPASPVAMASPTSAVPMVGGPSAEQIKQAGIVFDNGSPEWQVNGQKYQKQLKYQTPGGPEDIKFEITVNEGAISSVDVMPLGTAPITKELQAKFKTEVGKAIVGKKLAELGTIDRVGGASLTTRAFNLAVLGLRQQVAK